MSKKKTHEEYVVELAEKNPNLEIIDRYIDAKTKILHRCKKHNIEWNISPSNALKGKGCSQCRSEKIINKNQKSHEQYINELQLINLDIEVIGNYIGANIKISHRCKICGWEWSATPSNLLSGTHCPKCSNHIWLTHDMYVEEVAIKNPTIEVLEKYIDMKTPILHRCTIHNFEWRPFPESILRGCGCKFCSAEKISQKLTKSHSEYVENVKIKNPTVEVIGKYIDNKEPILHYCTIHNVEWMARPYNILNGCGCEKCGSGKISEKLLKDTKWYVQRLKEKRPTIEIIDEYVDYCTPILHKCKIDGHIWPISPANILKGINCPKCGGYKGEQKIATWLENNNIMYLPQHRFNNCKDIKSLPFDFYIPILNSCVEYDGRQHFIPIDFAGKGKEWAEEQLKITQYHDLIKNKYCKENNIPLLRISYDENIEEKLSSFIHLI